jgi:hypothetical protein
MGAGQYKEKKPSDPTIAEKFNTYRPTKAGRFSNYKERVIDLLAGDDGECRVQPTIITGGGEE